MQTLPGPKNSTLADQLLGLMSCVTQGSDSRLASVAFELDLSLSQMRALLVMWRADAPVSVGELARAVGLSDAATVRVVDRLIFADLADRREDACDRRIKRVTLSATGRRTVQRLVAAKREGLERFAESLLPEERDRLTGALAPIVARLGLADESDEPDEPDELDHH